MFFDNLIKRFESFFSFCCEYVRPLRFSRLFQKCLDKLWSAIRRSLVHYNQPVIIILLIQDRLQVVLKPVALSIIPGHYNSAYRQFCMILLNRVSPLKPDSLVVLPSLDPSQFNFIHKGRTQVVSGEVPRSNHLH